MHKHPTAPMATADADTIPNAPGRPTVTRVSVAGIVVDAADGRVRLTCPPGTRRLDAVLAWELASAIHDAAATADVQALVAFDPDLGS